MMVCDAGGSMPPIAAHRTETLTRRNERVEPGGASHGPVVASSSIHAVSRRIVYSSPSTCWSVLIVPRGSSVNSVLRTMSISWAARLAATARLRLPPVSRSEVPNRAATPAAVNAKIAIATTISTIEKPRSSETRRLSTGRMGPLGARGVDLLIR